MGNAAKARVDSRTPIRYFDVHTMSLFITFEGLDLSGKSTQVSLLQDRLEKDGAEVLVLREPGGTPTGEAIRSLLLDPRNADMSDMCEMLLFSASRSQLVHTVIRPALAKGVTVICDRFYDSTTAYQGGGRGIAAETVRAINDAATGGLVPEITFFLDVDPAEIERRMNVRGSGPDRMELNDALFRARVREAYLALARSHSRFCVLQGDLPAGELAESIWTRIKRMEIRDHA